MLANSFFSDPTYAPPRTGIFFVCEFLNDRRKQKRGGEESTEREDWSCLTDPHHTERILMTARHPGVNWRGIAGKFAASERVLPSRGRCFFVLYLLFVCVLVISIAVDDAYTRLLFEFTAWKSTAPPFSSYRTVRLIQHDPNLIFVFVCELIVKHLFFKFALPSDPAAVSSYSGIIC